MTQPDRPQPENLTQKVSQRESHAERSRSSHFSRILSDDAHRNLQSDAGPRPQARPRRILIADDERVIADTLAVILRNAGYETAVAYDGLEAVEKCESFQPDLVVSDVVMPRMNGIQAAIRIRQRFPACKILLFSGQAASTGSFEGARRSGYDFELLTKPVHPSELLAKIAA